MPPAAARIAHMFFNFSELRKVNLICRIAAAMFVAAALVPVAGLAAEPARTDYSVPQFRHLELDVKPPKLDRQQLKLLADNDFPPFSYADANGNPKGLAVELSLSLCARLAIQCTVELKPWTELADALARKEGDAVISGLKLDER